MERYGGNCATVFTVYLSFCVRVCVRVCVCCVHTVSPFSLKCICIVLTCKCAVIGCVF